MKYLPHTITLHCPDEVRPCALTFTDQDNVWKAEAVARHLTSPAHHESADRLWAFAATDTATPANGWTFQGPGQPPTDPAVSPDLAVIEAATVAEYLAETLGNGILPEGFYEDPARIVAVREHLALAVAALVGVPAVTR